MAERKLISMVNAKCEGVAPYNDKTGIVPFKNNPHEVQLKAYDDGETMPLSCKYMNTGIMGERVCDPYLVGNITDNLNKCRLYTKK